MTTGRDAIYIQVEVGAISAADDLARLIGISSDTALAGVVRFWHACIRDNRRIAEFQHVDRSTLATLTASSFGRSIEPEQLSLLGFVRKADEAGDLWRVRGLSRYIEMEKRRSESDAARALGGETRARSSRRVGGKFTSSPPAAHQLTTSCPPADDQQNTTLDGRRETGDVRQKTGDVKDSRAKKPRGSDSPPTGDHAVAIERTTADFQRLKGVKYGFTGRDAKAVKELLAFATPDEISTRWCRAIQSPGYPSVATLSELKTHWNHFAAAKVIDITKGVAPVGDFSHLAIGESRRLDGTF